MNNWTDSNHTTKLLNLDFSEVFNVSEQLFAKSLSDYMSYVTSGIICLYNKKKFDIGIELHLETRKSNRQKRKPLILTLNLLWKSIYQRCASDYIFIAFYIANDLWFIFQYTLNNFNTWREKLFIDMSSWYDSLR